jgi:hypothetical protein
MEKKMKSVKCIICEKELEKDVTLGDVKPTDIIEPIYDGLSCRSYGNYGSQVYDPMADGQFLLFYICDDCMVKKGDLVTYVRYIKKSINLDEKTFSQKIKEDQENEKKYKKSDLSKKFDDMNRSLRKNISRR